MLNWELVNKKDIYDTLCGWWTQHKAFNDKIIELKSLPNRVFIVTKGEDILYAVPVYISDSDFCYIGWVTSNPLISPLQKKGALEYLYNIINIVMKSQGYDHILSKANSKSLQRIAEKAGYENVGTTTYHVKNL